MATPTRIAVYSGTFDPFTLGHQDVVRRAAGVFDQLIIGVAAAHHKKTLFSLEARLQQVQEETKALGNVNVLPFDGLIVDFCTAQQAAAIVRGIRNITDFDYEAQMAAMNRKLRPQVETVFLVPDASLQCISSTLVREISKLGGDVSQMVSANVVAALGKAHAAGAPKGA
ncbi:MAG TPA: pantetheine-phosphate adenylyltransferase [Polaromonas sp.]|uniref:pantetheine-phosphate adenylyltransferase n=1 Tax=Polaromonas sp. TaxID=1869339 RepID=UPI002D71E6A7|nr:pantetheine-phosphate adenylyltransferase [Polaromonas sp.]HYW58535.1 pantetheine-phosphate adenylyltransferase [Polaromonas sp.]